MMHASEARKLTDAVALPRRRDKERLLLERVEKEINQATAAGEDHFTIEIIGIEWRLAAITVSNELRDNGYHATAAPNSLEVSW